MDQYWWLVSRIFVHDVATPRVVFGRGALGRAGQEVERLDAHRVLLISTRSSAASGKSVADALGNKLVARIDEVAMHVPAEVAESALRSAETTGADLLVCIGGGSATGLGKAVAAQTSVPILAIPTTYAGSEMTSIWGRTEDGQKVTGRDQRVLPRTVIYDPDLTVGLSARQSASSGMNAAAHCVEALYASNATPVTTLLAVHGLQLLAKALPAIATDPSDLKARTDALQGAWYSGWVLGATTMGLHHKLCHVLGGSYNLPHSAVHSAVLPYATAWNASADVVAMSLIASALESADAAGGLWDLALRAGAPTSLTDVGFDPDDIDAIATLVAASPPENPRPVTQEGVRELLLASCAGTRPTTG